MIRLSSLVGLMAASASGCSYRPEFSWPLHKALVTLVDDSGGRYELPVQMEVGGLPEAGRGIPALGSAILELLSERILVPSADDERLLLVNDQVIPELRRVGLALDAAVMDGVYRAALLWATESSICEKNWATARASWGATVASATPKPHHRVV